MTEDMHPDVAAVLRQAQQLQSLMDDQLHRMNSQTFTGTDESETVRVTLDGHHNVTGVVIEDGLLGLGVEEVQKRLNEALREATAAAGASLQADRDRIDAAVADITDQNR
ncbi:YbaB/EbfC family nucleoid-associated protein [Mycobacterium sp. GA-1199]|uniref:YbaB/EbfC family nucleoid-associated protein n=1 Tax=Mycobacterium sp. GA-1199 TaxID=1772287 RepID=UPI0012E3BCFE|nr:YbaB/EbfC family nucleoid-associated protein [Mycobacterium sp. GA-1199]